MRDLETNQTDRTRFSVLLLKTKSTPADSYEEYFSNPPYTCTFVPVLEHRSNVENLATVRSLLAEGKLGRTPEARYGGMIFTSQRAVEGFAKVVAELDVDSPNKTNTETSPNDPPTAPPSPIFPIYVVGPATSRTLSSLLSTTPTPSALAPLNAHVLGSSTGNGEALAHYILQHYPTLPNTNPDPDHTVLPLLFLVGEQRRAIIPDTLASAPTAIPVDELVIYETGVMPSFAEAFSSHLTTTTTTTTMPSSTTIVIVFSPSGCEAMLRCLGFIDASKSVTEKARANKRDLQRASSSTHSPLYIIATIGPTTRDYLAAEFGFEADVCAEKPSPEGLGEGIRNFLAGNPGSTI